jgi:hypothetical protein
MARNSLKKIIRLYPKGECAWRFACAQLRGYRPIVAVVNQIYGTI